MLVTVIAEEMFFRVLIQEQIAAFLNYSTGGLILGAACATALFAIAHTTQIGAAFFLFLIAGAAYSGVYLLTNRISMAIWVHFVTNAGHFILLAYPLPK